MNSSIASTDDVTKAMDTDRVLREKELQNQLIDAERKIGFLREEYQNFQNMLAKKETLYTAKNANLLQLINAHADKIGVLKQKFRTLQNELHKKRQELCYAENVISRLKCCISRIRELNNKNLHSKEELQRQICNLNLEIITNSRRNQETLQNLEAEIVSTKQKLTNAKKRSSFHLKSLKNREKDLLTLDVLRNCNLTEQSANEDTDVSTEQTINKSKVLQGRIRQKCDSLLDSVKTKNNLFNLKTFQIQNILKSDSEHGGPLKINQYFNVD